MNRKEKNILLVSLENLEDGIKYRYYYNNDGGNARYCNSIMRAEVATKYVLSKVNIDEIVVIGSGATYDEGDELRKVPLKDGEEFFVSDINNMSEYSLYRYRLSEFLEGMDLEEHEMLVDIDPEIKESIVKFFNKFHLELGQRTEKKRKDIFFHRVTKNPEIYDELINALPAEFKDKETWLKRYLYSIMTDSFKMRALESNEDVMISFVPTTKMQEDSIDMENITKIIEMLKGEKNEFVNLYIDMQGLERTDDFTMVTVLSILKNEWNNKIQVKEILSTSKTGFAGEIKNELTRYEMNDLLAGMNAFVKYGKVGSLRKYWDERNIYDEHVEKLLFAMQYIDDGVSLCNISDLEYGISELRNVLAESASEEGTGLERSVINILEAGIRRDLGPLLDEGQGDDVDVLELLKWTYRKEFYQQTLTILESRIPRDFVKKGVLYYAENEEDRELAIKLLCDIYCDAMPKDRYQFNDINHFFIKFYCRRMVNYNQDAIKIQQDYAKLRAGMIEKDDPKFLRAYSLLEDKEELEELIFAYACVGQIRNQVSHGKSGVKKYPGQRKLRKENDNIRMIKDAVDYFIQQYDEAKRKIKGKEAVILTITGDDVKERAAKNRKSHYHKNNKHKYRDRDRDRERNNEVSEQKECDKKENCSNENSEEK